MTAAATNSPSRYGKPTRSPHALRGMLGFGVLLMPAMVLLTALFFIPILLVLAQSVFDPTFTLENFKKVFSNQGYMTIILRSLSIAAISTIGSLLLAYPVAYSLVFSPPSRRNIMMTIVLIPFWTNILIRCYSWMLILQGNGVVNSLLIDGLGVISQPIPLVFNMTGVLIGMIHYLVPMNILILYSAMKSLDLRLMTAAQSLGANPVRAFLFVFLPLTRSAIQASAILIFIVALGFYVTPVLLGGRSETTISVLVSIYFSDVLDWGFGSALAAVLLALTLAGLLSYQVVKKLDRRGGRAR